MQRMCVYMYVRMYVCVYVYTVNTVYICNNNIKNYGALLTKNRLNRFKTRVLPLIS